MRTPTSSCMLLADARLPVGGHTQSGRARAGGRGPASRRRRPGVPACPAAHRHPRRGRHRRRRPAPAAAGRRRCAEVEAAWAARTPSPALRRRRGARRAATCGSAAPALARRRCRACRARAAPRRSSLGVVGAVAGMTPADLPGWSGTTTCRPSRRPRSSSLPLDPAEVDRLGRSTRCRHRGAGRVRSPTSPTPDDIPAAGRPADRGVGRGPRRHHQEVVPCLRPPVHPRAPARASPAPSAPARAR